MDSYILQHLFVAVALLLAAVWIRKLYIRSCRIQLFAYRPPNASPTQYNAIRHAPTLSLRPICFSVSCRPAYVVINAHRRDKHSDVSYEREILTAGDGGSVAIDWYPSHNSNKPDTRPIAVVMSGVGGSSKEYYSLADGKLNYRVVVMNHRGCGGARLTSPRPYNAHETADIRLTVNHESSNCVLSAAVGISSPFDMPTTVRAMEDRNFLNDYVFRPALVAGTKRYLLKNEKQRSLSELDDIITAKVFNTKDSWGYYELASSKPYVEHIKIPFLVFASRDDTINPVTGTPFDLFESNPNTALVVTNHGGHIGFYQGLRPRSWHTDPVAEFFGTVVQPSKKPKPHHILDIAK
ncbi:AB-hydrolase YheT [Linderina pennispora]|uniref:AB-hydrolase YheT n=1 Tax=Linderina pennispora TaxID=61395 RepID=A0A1Y1WK11_9FUNG|nr:AB-hydrolase YheT [Linderina pennispora]ORX73877.1 AB-hydrolase YheT [Linderina pennispora]